MEPEVPDSLKHIFNAYNEGSLEERERIRVIGVMGLTGAGKSTFIKRLTGDDNVVIGRNIYSQTEQVSLSRVNFLASNNQSYDVFFADTPGFDASTGSETNVLKNIVTWLGAMRQIDIKLSGIIYLHRITDDRVGGMSRRNLRMLQKLVGADKMANVLLVSTRWEETPLAEPDSWWARMEERQNQIEQGFVDHSGNHQQGFWQTYIQNGARVMRHDGSIDSARRIVDNIIICSTPIYIQIQDEVSTGKDLSETAAGQAIMSDLEKEATRLAERLASLIAEGEDEEEISLVQQALNYVFSEQIKMRELTNQKLIALIGGLVLGGVGVGVGVGVLGVRALVLAAGSLNWEVLIRLMRLLM